MADRITTYNPRKVTMACGNHIVTGFADDSMISVEPAGDGTSAVVGADGEIVRSIDPSTLYNVKITLEQTSRTNAYLKNMYEKDKAEGTGTFSINIADIMGNEKFASPVAWVQKMATWQRGKTQQNVEWNFQAAMGEFK